MQNYSVFLVTDFEATCDHPTQCDPMEIIEFPVLLVNGETFQVEKMFHSYVKPDVHPILSPFCTQLTGIVQETIDNADSFSNVLIKFNDWIYNDAKLICPKTQQTLRPFTFATCGNWDFQMMLYDQCARQKLKIPPYMRSWINVKKSFVGSVGKWPKSLNDMVTSLKMTPVGRQHSGVDDCHNLVQIMKALADQGCVFKNTNQI